MWAAGVGRDGRTGQGGERECRANNGQPCLELEARRLNATGAQEITQTPRVTEGAETNPPAHTQGPAHSRKSPAQHCPARRATDCPSRTPGLGVGGRKSAPEKTLLVDTTRASGLPVAPLVCVGHPSGGRRESYNTGISVRTPAFSPGRARPGLRSPSWSLPGARTAPTALGCFRGRVTADMIHPPA